MVSHAAFLLQKYSMVGGPQLSPSAKSIVPHDTITTPGSLPLFSLTTDEPHVVQNERSIVTPESVALSEYVARLSLP